MKKHKKTSAAPHASVTKIVATTALTATLSGLTGAFYLAIQEEGREAAEEYRPLVQKSLEKTGLTDVTIEFGMATTFFKCKGNNFLGLDFKAKDAAGNKVSGHVCTGGPFTAQIISR